MVVPAIRDIVMRDEIDFIALEKLRRQDLIVGKKWKNEKKNKKNEKKMKKKWKSRKNSSVQWVVPFLLNDFFQEIYSSLAWKWRGFVLFWMEEARRRFWGKKGAAGMNWRQSTYPGRIGHDFIDVAAVADALVPLPLVHNRFALEFVSQCVAADPDNQVDIGEAVFCLHQLARMTYNAKRSRKNYIMTQKSNA